MGGVAETLCLAAGPGVGFYLGVGTVAKVYSGDDSSSLLLLAS